MTPKAFARLVWGFIAVLVVIATQPVRADSGCRACHAQASGQHGGSELDCVACHGGDARGTTDVAAHRGMIAAPGEMANAAASCGRCHAAEAAAVAASPMHTARRVVGTTRRVLDGAESTQGSLQLLGQTVADSLLRKLCASCHLGQPRSGAEEPIRARGGGCLACHLDPMADAGHPQLTGRVADARCVGCHSRSGRISLNYAGLAEVDPPANRQAWGGLSRLSDGRLVEHKTPDVHQRAGMGCVDCHTGPGLMGLAGGIDIACADCHANQRPRLSLADQPEALARVRHRLPFAAGPRQRFLQTAAGTPLWHVELRGGQILLHPKGGGRVLPVPPAGPEHVPEADRHATLDCDACHATWAPQCHGCHLTYEPSPLQWDHAEGRVTAGLWRERRWGIRNDLPPLGRGVDGKITPVVPGMILTLFHPELEEPLFVRRFAALAPHTTGQSRKCNECHGNAQALGLGEGELEESDEGPAFRPREPMLPDGLGADAWTALGRQELVPPTPHEARPLTDEELRRLLRPLETVE